MDTKQLKRIADAIEEILRLVKKDMEPKKKQKRDQTKASACMWRYHVKYRVAGLIPDPTTDI